MQPLDRFGQPIEGADLQADADTVEGVREYAQAVLGTNLRHAPGAPFVWAVQIVGRLMELTGCWTPVLGNDAKYTREALGWATATPLLAPGHALAGYPPAVDYFQVVHERGPDGSCKCGHHKAPSV